MRAKLERFANAVWRFHKTTVAYYYEFDQDPIQADVLEFCEAINREYENEYKFMPDGGDGIMVISLKSDC